MSHRSEKSNRVVILSVGASALAWLAFAVLTPAAVQARSLMDVLSPTGLLEDARGFVENAEPLGDALFGGAAFDALREGRISIDEAIGRAVRDGLRSPWIGISKGQDMSGFARRGQATSREFRMTVGGVPLCGDRVIRAHRLANGETVVVGSAPRFDAVEPGNAADWPALDDAAALVATAVEQAGYAAQVSASWRVVESERCVEPARGGQREAWNLTVSAGGWRFRAIADDRRLYSLHKDWIDATGTVYDNNKRDGETVSKTFSVSSSDGSLANSFFKVNAGGETAAKETSKVYDYAVSDKRFEQTNAFYHATRQMEFLVDAGFEWADGAKPITLKLFDDAFNENPDNAMYLPSSTSPTIFIGDGSGTILDNLTTDSDVVSHEVGHHIIYQTLKTVEGEQLVVHEGLADFLTYAETDDSCLGESICVETGGSACAVRRTCLRTAATTYKLSSSEVASDEHLKGQVVSAFLWDLRGDDYGMPLDTLTKTVVRAISLFGPSSGYHDLVVTMLWADKELNDSEWGCKIYDAAVGRGFEPYIKTVDCDNPKLAITGTTERTSGTRRSTTTSSGGWFNCGVVGGRGVGDDFDGSPNVALMVLLVLAPLGIAWVSRRSARAVLTRSAESATEASAVPLRRAG